MTDPSTGGPERAPRSRLRRLVPLLVAAVVAAAITFAVGQLPEGTAAGALIIRAVVGLTIGIVLIVVVRRMLAVLGNPPPPPPPTVEAEEVDVVYVCSVCGTRVRLEVAATGKAPRHCAEEMEPEIQSR